MAGPSDADRKRLWAQSGNQCAFLGCRQALVSTDVIGSPSGLIIGEEAHIVAESGTGPRCDPNMLQSERNSYTNLILLCPTHHTLIDKEEGVHFSVETLRAMKRDHERMVATGVARTDYGLTRQNLVVVADEWSDRAGLEDWAEWASALTDVQPVISINRFEALRALSQWLLARYWPDQFPGMRKSMSNFLYILADFVQYFSHIASRNDDALFVERYDRSAGDADWRQRDELLRRFDVETRTVAELALELTRAANLVCDVIRVEVDDQFRMLDGKLIIRISSGFGSKTLLPEYTSAERAGESPYPGLIAFDAIRATRDHHFPGPARFVHTTWEIND